METAVLLDRAEETIVKKEVYEKPYISEEKTGIGFIEQVLESQFGKSELVMTCTKCHHCR